MRGPWVLFLALALTTLGPASAAGSARPGEVRLLADLPGAGEAREAAAALAGETAHAALDAWDDVVATADAACPPADAGLPGLCRPEACSDWGDAAGCLVWSSLAGSSATGRAAAETVVFLLRWHPPGPWEAPGNAASVVQQATHAALDRWDGAVEAGHTACAGPEAFLLGHTGPVPLGLCRPDACGSWADAPACLVWSDLGGTADAGRAGADALVVVTHHTVEFAAQACTWAQGATDLPGPFPGVCREP